MTSFLKHTNQLHNNEFGFRSKLGTIDALTFSTNAIFLDFKEVFDTADHTILVEKLRIMGFHGPVKTLIKSNLTNKENNIHCGDTESFFYH